MCILWIGIAVVAMLVAGCAGTTVPSTVRPTVSSSAAGGAASVPVPAVTQLVAPGATITKVTGGLSFAEGPLWLSDGRLIVSDVNGDAVLAVTADGAKSDFRRPSRSANGHALDRSGLVVEADGGDDTHHGSVSRINADGSATVLADSFHGKHFNSPNDLIVKRDGTIWFTDPTFDEHFGAELRFSGVYRFDPKTRAVTLVSKVLSEPNGIAFSPDEKTLYVSDTTRDQLSSFAVAADDSVGPARDFGEFTDGCDGIGVDEQGNVWATTCGSNVDVTTATGVNLGDITFPGTTTNLAWGGADGKTLFVTTQQGDVYSLALTVRETH